MKNSQFFCLAALAMLAPHISEWIAMALFAFYTAMTVLWVFLEKKQ